MPWIIIGIIVSYLLGSVPTAYIFGRLLKGIDIREFGSGNVGATNALRVLGKAAGVTVLALDVLKGFVAVSFLGDIIDGRLEFLAGEQLRTILGLACISGHNWTIFLRFKGGKGMATTLGVLLGLAVKVSGLKLILLFVVLTWLLIFIIFRIVSVASILAGISLPICMFLFKGPGFFAFASIVLALFIILRHKANLKRLFQGKELRFKIRA